VWRIANELHREHKNGDTAHGVYSACHHIAEDDAELGGAAW
jgi:hypothetical protein